MSDNMQTYTINIRPRRQATFPTKLLEELGVSVGDDFEAYAEDKKLILKPKKQIALEAFKELQNAVQESGVTEKEMLEKLKSIFSYAFSSRR